MRTFSTKNFLLIQKACSQSLKGNSISIITGASGTGKTVALQNFCHDRNDTVMISETTPSKHLDFADTVRLIIVDGVEATWKSLNAVRALIVANPKTGFVISMNQNAFLSKSDAIRRQAYRLASARSRVTQIMGESEPFKFRTHIRLVGDMIQVLRNREFREHFVFTRSQRHPCFPMMTPAQAASSQIIQLMSEAYKLPIGVNTIYFLRKPSREDVLGICHFFGMPKRCSSIYQNCSSISEVLKMIAQWRQLQKVK